MRLIGELNDSKVAKKFSAYLLTQGVTPQVESEGGKWEIWVKEEDHLERAVKELAEFEKDPNHERYRDSFEKANEIAREEERRRLQLQKNIVKVNQRKGVGKRAPLTLLLIVICSLVALATNFGYANSERDVVFKALAFSAVDPPASTEIMEANGGDFDNINVRTASLQRGEIWRLITPIFIHFGPLHIVFNMIWLFQFGHMIENRYGTFWLAVLVLMSAAIPNFVQSVVPEAVGGSGPDPGLYQSFGFLLTRLGGMSGVVYGLFGFIWMKSVYDPGSGFRLPQSTVIILVVWLFACVFVIPNVANWAHGVGLLVGMFAGYLPTILGGPPATR